MAVAGQMAGIGIVDARHRPLAPYDSWLDTRCGAVADELSARLGDRITATAGCAPTISIGPKMLWWRRHHPEVCGAAASFVTAAGYVAGRAAGLPGGKAFIDPSYLHFTSVADVGRGRWDEGLGRAVGIDPACCPRSSRAPASSASSAPGRHRTSDSPPGHPSPPDAETRQPAPSAPA
jgi:xylulokinase